MAVRHRGALSSPNIVIPAGVQKSGRVPSDLDPPKPWCLETTQDKGETSEKGLLLIKYSKILKGPRLVILLLV